MKSIVQEEQGHCWNCGCHSGIRSLEEHHIFGGANRKWSEKYGLKVHLCYECHRDNKKGVHGSNQALRGRLFEAGQQAFERDHKREEFMRVFGKNYL